MITQSPASNPTSKHPILWGAYLACSWTWCIGMFYPTLLLRDFGTAGFLIFAIPNVLGAAAMGWFIKSRIDSERFVENHPTAVWWFSTITLLFHVFWILWISNFIKLAFPIPDSYLIGVAATAIAFSVVSNRTIKLGRAPQLALVLLVFSVSTLIATFINTDLDPARESLMSSAPHSISESFDSLWMIPLMTFGFIFCPYLDITFHHARQGLDTKQGGRLGFTIGFVAFFSLMIILTTRYAGVLSPAINGNAFPDSQPIAPWLGSMILAHIVCQWIFTIRVHLDRMKTIPGAQSKQSLLLGLSVIAGLIGITASKIPSHNDLTSGELIYRTFLSFYGLLFPTYMLFNAILKKRSKSIPSMWITMIIAAPVFWIGFMEQQSIWLIPGMIIVLIGAGILKAQRIIAS